MKTFNVLFLIVLFALSLFGQNITATTDNGTKVILKPDKTWDYVKDEPKVIQSSKQEETTFNPYLFAKDNAEVLAKSEFETETEYEKRLSDLYSKNNKTYAVNIDPTSFTYSAERQAFSVLIYTSSGVNIVERKYGMNSSAMIRFDFPISPSEASQVKNNIEFWVYGYPVGYSTYSSRVEFLPTKIVLKDRISGKVYFENVQPNFITGTSQTENDSDSEISPNYSTPATKPNSGTEVQVKGYYRRDGTYVRPHTRSAPRRKN